MSTTTTTAAATTSTTTTTTTTTTISQGNITRIKNVVLFYDDYPTRKDANFQVTQQIATPLVSYVTAQGNVNDTFFDSFIFYSLWLYNTKYPNQSYIDSWISYLYNGSQVANLDSAVGSVKNTLNSPGYKVNVFLSVPVDYYNQSWPSVQNNIDKLLANWNNLNPKNLNLVGFYWGFTEDLYSVNGSNIPSLVTSTANYLHSKGYKLIIIPYKNAGVNENSQFHSVGIDYVTVQPNYAWDSTSNLNDFTTANNLIVSGYSDGAEEELPVVSSSITCCGGSWWVNFQTYINQSYNFHWNRNMINTYYHGADISELERYNYTNYRAAYDMLYSFLVSTR
jgi:hypothetical protein